jgi:hypothetical protein
MCGLGRWLRGLLVALVVLTSSGIAYASDRCAAASLLENLPSEDRDFLRNVCRFSDAQASAWRAQNPAEFAKLMRISARLLGGPEWPVTTLFQLLPDGVFESVQFDVACSDDGSALKQALNDALQQRREEQAKREPTDRQPPILLLPESCNVSRKEGEAVRSSDEPGQVTVPMLVPDGVVARVLVGGRTPTVWTLGPSELTVAPPKKGAKAIPVPRLDLRFARIPYGTPFAVSFQAPSKPLNGDDAVPLPLVVHAAAFGSRLLLAEATAAGCVDIEVKSNDPLSFFVDGAQVVVDRNQRLYSSILWVPTDATPREHRVSVTSLDAQGGAHVVATQPVLFDPTRARQCVNVRYDLTTRDQQRTIGLLDVDADPCVDAGIDSPKLRAYVSAFLEQSGKRVSDLRSFSSAADYFLSFRRALDALGGAAVGADRGRLDSVQNLATGAQELVRQGFAALLVTRLHCTRRQSGWDYAFVAQTIDLAALGQRERDPISGIDLDGVVRTEIELITSRSELGPHIERTLAQLFAVPALVLEDLPPSWPFQLPITARLDAQIPDDRSGTKYVVALNVHQLSGYEANQICPVVDDIRTLRARRDFSQLEALRDWHAAPARPLAADGRIHRFELDVEPKAPRPLLLRASLNQLTRAGVNVLGLSYQCVDTSRRSYELFAEVAAWAPVGAGSPARKESSISAAALIGIEHQPRRWPFTYGVGLGYSMTIRNGNAPSTWDGLDQGAAFGLDGTARYRVVDHGIYLAALGQFRASLCEISGGHWCRVASRSLLLTGRVLLLEGLHLVDKSDVSSSFSAFRGNDSDVGFNVGAFLEPGLSVQIKSSLIIDARFLFGSNRLFDFRRSVADADVYQRALWGVSIGETWEL